MRRLPGLFIFLATSAACRDATRNGPVVATPAAVPSTVSSTVPASPAGPAELTGEAFAFSGTRGPAFLDYIVYERGPSRVWVPIGSTGSVEIFDVSKKTFTRVDGFKTAERDVRGKKRTIGPNAASVGDGFVYIGDRATAEVCPVDVKTLAPARCLKLPTSSDGVVFVRSSREVWVTAPNEQSLAVLDASTPGALKMKTLVKVDGEPEGYAVDESRGLFFTNLEDKGATVVIDVRSHKVKGTWKTGCGADGPRGLAFDAAHDFIVVACTDGVRVLDAAHDGAALGKLDTGAGVDNIDYLDAKKLVYVAASKAAKLVVARIDDKGQLTVVASADTAESARNAVADENGNVYVGDSLGARLFVFAIPAR